MEKITNPFFSDIHTSEMIENLAEAFDVYSRNVSREYDLAEIDALKKISNVGYKFLRLAALLTEVNNKT